MIPLRTGLQNCPMFHNYARNTALKASGYIRCNIISSENKKIIIHDAMPPNIQNTLDNHFDHNIPIEDLQIVIVMKHSTSLSKVQSKLLSIKLKINSLHNRLHSATGNSRKDDFVRCLRRNTFAQVCFAERDEISHTKVVLTPYCI